MPTTITDSSTFTDPIQGPADADAQNAASYNLGFQGLANRTRFLRNYCTDSGVNLPAAVQTTRYLSHDSARLWVPTQWTPGQTELLSEANQAGLAFDLTPHLPRNASIVRVRTLVDPGAARTGTTNRMLTELRGMTFGASFGAPAITEPVALQQAFDDTTGNLQWVTIDLSASPQLVSAAVVWRLFVRAGNDAGTNKDRVHGALVEFSCQTIRND